MRLLALVDSNVVIAAVADGHVHHAASFEMFTEDNAGGLAITAHSYAEAYSILTRQGEGAPFRFSPDEAWAALERVKAITTLVGLTADQTTDGIRDYSRGGGVGARLYDKLIGEAAVIHAIPTILTWNVGHMQGLFPNLKVVTPAAFTASR